ncbi:MULTISPECIES: DUF1178 family protein [Achromobacter]|jgi:hypothetical protein|uniref:DUF1178 family protein n=1 Tax=Achromobacter TaxID=222 RepID=UPI0006F29DFD|nr:MULTISPECIES: DUF1178 family protein [Achromobacter]OAE51791.1 hypothetical protein A7J67_10920 [Achromobacter xylosoxidans]OXC90237.1 hypothetical protein BMR85_014190 [Achromobacter sp. KAs 3-5]KRB12050.1 hypothetical protein ASD87_12640 [Achromobacter sp. Root170]MCP2516937.1 DUF1178 family protein [Achromobacter mucicolens]MCU6617868.1 DUF1178 family protein [Achromobacter mucicolens]
MALKVFDLECDHSHIFEGWFGSHEDYDAQQARGLVTCPVCGSATITKRLSAPRLNVAHLHAPAAQPLVPPGASDAEKMAALQAAVMRQVRALVRSTENVGPRFAEEARRIHEGDADDRPIRGTATVEEREALAEDGIEVMAVPDFLDDERLQ